MLGEYMVYETSKLLAELLEKSGLFRQVFVTGLSLEKAAEDIVREPGIAVIYTGEEGQIAGNASRRELVFSLILKTVTIGKGDQTLKTAGEAVDSVFAALSCLPLCSWKVSNFGAGARESIYRIDVTYRVKA
jgi:hypothetical protein